MFTDFSKKMQAQFELMCKTEKLFRSSLTGQEVWDLYLGAFEKEDDPIFRDPLSTLHNCNLCNNFIRRYGNIVAINSDYKIMTIFDITEVGQYEKPSVVVSNALKKAKISNVFFETFNELNSLPYEQCNKNNPTFKLGLDKNHKRYTKEEAEKFKAASGEFIVKPNEIRTFDHLHLSLPRNFVDMSGDSIEQIMSKFRDDKNVFQRAMEEIPLDTLNLVKDLINQGSLLNGETHLYKVKMFIPLKEEYDKLASNKKDNWCWIASYKFQLAKFKNELIGLLCTELSEGEELNKACQGWNKRVDPANYMKAVAPITKKQIEDAKRFVEENGYEESFDRRHATIDDIKASEILHLNSGDSKVKSVSIFDNVKSSSTRHKRSEFDGIEEVSIDKFMSDILPTCTSVEAFLTNKQDGNFASLTTTKNNTSKPIFKWSNNYSWTFNGNLAGKSLIKEAVESRGGKTDGVVNIRLAFPNTESDYDLHVIEPNGNHIYYPNRRVTQKSSGRLDLDAQGADGMFPPEKRVENVIYTDANKMPKGRYLVYVNNYSNRDNNAGFIIEIEINGDVTTFNYDKHIPNSKDVRVCNINLDKNGEFTIEPLLPLSSSNTLSREIYGLETNQFHKVNLICVSPNHWGDNKVGNKHYFFMLDKCKTEDSIRSFHAENLIPELAQHRKVLEVLGNTTMIEPSEKQLSGLGFNSTIKDELIVKLQGSFKRVIKIKFNN